MAPLGSTGLDVHPLCLGGNVFGWTADEEASFAVLDRYAAAGGNFLDTADVYSSWVPDHPGGESEAVIGRWMAARGNRADMVIATKVGMHFKADLANLRPETVTAACEASLQRLGVERIDVYYAHRDDEDVPLAESLGAFDRLVREGKIGHIGLSQITPDRLREALEVVARERYAPIRVLQPHYNLLDRAGFETELRSICAEHDIAVVPFYGLAMGFLTGKYARDSVPADMGTPRAKGVMKVYGGQERSWQVLEALRGVAAAHGATPASVALAWLRRQDTVVAPIASARSVQQLEDFLGMTDLELAPGDLAALDTASA
ncbi:aldo/keto reductase [Paraconexibacter sp.]|uniref:aldo/keto reductase n=1 Tax=Paraconexibacter sp. TaxID=2949640 RepID=UPI0035683EDC